MVMIWSSLYLSQIKSAAGDILVVERDIGSVHQGRCVCSHRSDAVDCKKLSGELIRLNTRVLRCCGFRRCC